MQLARGGKPWILTSITFFLLFLIGSVFTRENVQFFFSLLSFFIGIISILLLVFFRDPKRTIGDGIVAAADGIIRNVCEVTDEDIGKAWCISTFMNIYHVHVNRMPIKGTIKTVTYIPGSHLPAFTKESERNERVVFLVETIFGLVKIVLIAGTLARRIVPYVKKNDKINKGEKISLIRLGSRVDVYLPKKMNITINVKKKDRVKAGVSQLGTSNV